MPSPSANGQEEAIFTQEEIALVKSLERSRPWRLIRDALCLERENRFKTLAEGAEPFLIAKQTGAIELIQWLLQEGPRFVVWYRRYMDAQEDAGVKARARKRLDESERVEAAPPEVERTYDPSPEPPEF